MKKGWISKKVKESCYGWAFERRYIKSPAGNYYEIFRNSDEGMRCLSSQDFYLIQDMRKTYKVHGLGVATYSGQKPKRVGTLKEAVQTIYELEASGTYPKALSNDIENYRECKWLFSIDESEARVMSY